MQKIAVYPGSFDPITNGHISILRRGLKIFDKVIVGVLENPNKTSLFTDNERGKMIEQLGEPNVIVKRFHGLLVDFCLEQGAQVIIRGLRAVSDFDHELQLALVNRRMNRDIETIFLMTSYQYSYLSSSLVKDMAYHGGNIEGLVPDHVEKALKKKYSTAKKGAK